MKKFHVVVHYEGAYAFEVEADNEDEATEVAELKFADLDPAEIVQEVADISSDCWEV